MEKETPKEKIQFKPLHDGMGFHPFSDGLPYAPASKTVQHTQTRANAPVAAPKTTSVGSGAVTAGRPQFTSKTNPRPLPLHSQLNLNPSATLTKTTERKAEIIPTTNTPLLRRRAFAYLLDMTVHAGFWLLTNLAAFFVFNYQIDPAIFAENIVQFVGFFVLSQWLFIALQEMLFETTLGKTFFNLEFKRNHGSLLFRSMVFMAGVLFFGLGFYFRPQDRFGEITLKSRIES